MVINHIFCMTGSSFEQDVIKLFLIEWTYFDYRYVHLFSKKFIVKILIKNKNIFLIFSGMWINQLVE